MNFSSLKSTAWFKNYTNWLPLLQWGGWIIATFILAKVFWIWALYFTTPTDIKPFRAKPVAVKGVNNKVDVNSLVNLNLFGSIVVDAPQAEVEPETEAPVTKLNLKLRGLFSADDVKKANAIIEDDRGKQAVYFIGDKLEVSGRVFLRQVYADRVILETNGKREALRLDIEEIPTIKVSSNKPSNTKNRKKKVEDKRGNQRISRQLNRYRNKLASDPQSVADVISGRPHFENGELRGFNISPGKNKRLFRELGLRRGDLVTSINGVPLTNMQEAMTLMSDAQSIQELDVEIQRGGETLNLLLNLNEKVGL